MSWASADDTVATVADDPNAAEITVRAVGPGATTLTVVFGEQKRELPIAVTGRSSGNAGGAGGAGGVGGGGGAGGQGGA